MGFHIQTVQTHEVRRFWEFLLLASNLSENVMLAETKVLNRILKIFLLWYGLRLVCFRSERKW